MHLIVPRRGVRGWTGLLTVLGDVPGGKWVWGTMIPSFRPNRCGIYIGRSDLSSGAVTIGS